MDTMIADRPGPGAAGAAPAPVAVRMAGMKQRLGIASALLGDPDLLILDEPTNGLDPPGIREVRALLSNLAAAGKTVLVSSHLLDELQHVAGHLIMIDSGRLVFAGPVDE